MITRDNRSARCSLAAVLASLAVVSAVVVPVRALINPKFTPADMVRGASVILAVEVTPPKDYAMRAKVTESLKGKAPAKTITLDFSAADMLETDDVAAAFGKSKSAVGVMVLTRESEGSSGAIQIAGRWFSVSAGDEAGTYNLDVDRNDFDTVWSGSAGMLVRAVKHARKNPLATFPVEANIRWRRDAVLGRLEGPARGCLRVDLGGKIGELLLVLSPAGDVAYRRSAKSIDPVDVTAKLGLKTASRMACAGDYNADGRTDLALVDGNSVVFAMHQADGTVQMEPAGLGPGGTVISMATSDIDGDDAGLVIVTDRHSVVFRRLIRRSCARRGLKPIPEKTRKTLDQSGPGVLADFTGDGRCDLLQVFEGGLVLWSGKGRGWFSDPNVTPMGVLRRPSDVLCGDYDGDGSLDVLVVGADGLKMIARTGGGKWIDRTGETGELTRHGNANRKPITAVRSADVVGGGLQGALLTMPSEAPAIFFNRGFAAFGLSRKLLLTESKLKSAPALDRGQQTALLADINADTAPDLLAVDQKNTVRVLYGDLAEGARLIPLTLDLPVASADPVTVTVSRSKRVRGTIVLRPGQPHQLTFRKPGPVELTWRGPDRKVRTKRLIVVRPQRFTLRNK